MTKSCLVALSVLAMASTSSAAVQFFNSSNFGNNATMRNNWLSAIGIASGEHFADFESYAVGTNLNGVGLGGGATLTHPSGSALVQSSSSFFGNSNPIGTRALALDEISGAITLTFSTPVDYIGGFEIDNPGSTLRVTLTDSSTATINLESTAVGGDSAEFWGVFRNDMPAITMAEFLNTNGGDGEWGLDNLEYGVVPEPGTIAVMGAGLLLLARRRIRR